MLEALIPSKTRVKLLSLFLLNPGREYYVREIARMTEENTNAVRRELANLESFGLITGQKKGNQQYYTVKRDFFLYDDLQKIVIRTEGVARTIRENLAGLGPVDCMFVYGSFARHDAGAKSDIDLFIVGDVDENRVIPLVHESEQATNREINYTLMRRDEFARRKQNGDPFVKNVMDEPRIMIIGTCDD
ncbi:nucleotidyltransferase domain-containing protein [Methanoregula sp.]|uniref:nucleotidyltransferase domain-containing protein n=3 Tax=Methanoregula sp. TaxID=2052170 RepID=UPI003C4BF127